MTYHIKIYDSFCGTEEFVINDVHADDYDFGHGYDAGPGPNSNVGHHGGCINRVWEPIPPTDTVLKKYNISSDEYYFICQELKHLLSFQRCIKCSNWDF